MTKKKELLSDERQQRRELAESSLIEFIELVHPKRLLGNIHREIITSFWCKADALNHQLLLLPRDHMKSALVAYRAAWELTKNPTIRILYISSTSNLATKQLKFIKDILTCENYRIHWPEMVNKEEMKREKWTEREISVDHPLRKDESIRDPSIFTAGLTTNIVGMHSDINILDDVVVQSNAYTEDGREKVRGQYSHLTSIAGTNSRTWVVGTRYHPLDLYADLIQRKIETYDEVGNIAARRPLYEILERQVESVGDGTGEFLWPRQQRSDGMWFGFNQDILAEKRSNYDNKIHFRAQYYNDPQDVDSSPIQRDLFQYYDQQHLVESKGRWFFRNEPLNVFAAVDFAYSTGKQADSTSIVVIGVDGVNNYYVLDIDRFKTIKISDYFVRILKLFEKWGFRKIRLEVSVAQKAIVEDIKENYIRRLGLSLAVEEYRPSRWQGSKEERIFAILEPKYANKQIWHYRGGHCQTLEEELLFTNPAHDDVKDALSSAIDMATAPKNIFRMLKNKLPSLSYHSKFGGVS